MYPLEFQPGKANSCLSDMYCAANIPSDFSCSSCKDLTFPRQISCSCKDETRLLNCKACKNRARIECFQTFLYKIQLSQSKAFTPFQEAYYKKLLQVITPPKGRRKSRCKAKQVNSH